MSVIQQLASALGQRDEGPNIALAHQIVRQSDKKAIQELVAHLMDKSKTVQNDCIKVLYEIGCQQPALIADYVDHFVELLDSKNNRMQWGAMTALHYLTGEQAEKVFAALPLLEAIANKGSVITRDQYVAILIKLCAVPSYATDAFRSLSEQLQGCPINQLPMYAEQALLVMVDSWKNAFVKILSRRLDEFEKESKRKRVEKVLKQMQKK